MTAAEIYAEVRDWPEGACVPHLYAVEGNGKPLHWVYALDPIPPALAELAFIGSGLKWLVSLWQYPLIMVIGITKDITGWRIELRNGDWQSTGHPTPLAAVGAAVRSVKQ